MSAIINIFQLYSLTWDLQELDSVLVHGYVCPRLRRLLFCQGEPVTVTDSVLLTQFTTSEKFA